MFLDSVRERQEAEERQRKESDGQEVQSFKEAVAARIHTVSNTPITERPITTKNVNSAKKDTKKSLKGVVVKKKLPKSTTIKSVEADGDDQREAKRRKVAE